MSSASTGASAKSVSTGAPTRSTSETTKPAPQAVPAAASVATAAPPVPVAPAPATAGSMRFVSRRPGTVTATQVHEKKDITAGRTSADATASVPPVPRPPVHASRRGTSAWRQPSDGTGLRVVILIVALLMGIAAVMYGMKLW